MPTFAKMAQKLTFDICRGLKLEGPLSSTREQEPVEETAWKYVNAYFADDPDAYYGIVQRPIFENRLRIYFRPGISSTKDADCEWYALRNAIYALGSRALYVSEGSTTTVHYTRSWGYFQNALSVQNNLLYSRTSIMAVQALMMMVI